ncbi:MAG TPA: hypothetical protein PK136_03650 [Coprothermobacter proteolyticus]|nr:hypothetical protein [Coprothermobacter proteolyticus]HOL53383.1 hypothetical protein [Coprothermobacter proteolyticus]HPO83744.1 hypothetical protein [Coprothermobacter proteolyticus]
MKKLLAITAVIVLLAAMIPVVTLAAQGNGARLNLGNRMKPANAPLTATPLSTEQLNRAYQIVASALSTTTTNLKNLEEKYDVGLGAIIRAQAIVTATTGVTLDQVLSYMMEHKLIEGLDYFGVDLDKFKTSLETLTDKITAELKNAGINIPGLRGLGKGLGLGNRWSYRNTATTTPLTTVQLSKVYQVVASALGTSTTNLDNLREKYDVGLVEIIKAQAIVTSTTGVTLDQVLSYTADHTLIQALSNFGVSQDKFETALKTLTDKISAELEKQGLPIPGWLTHALKKDFDKGKGPSFENQGKGPSFGNQKGRRK